MTELTNRELKILKFIKNHKSLTYSNIYKKFPDFKDLYHRFYNGIHFIDIDDPCNDVMGCEYDDSNNPIICTVSRDGNLYLDSKKWFNAQYVVTSIIIPILLGVVSALITTVLTHVL